jgi:hypothetical protein
MSGNSNNNKQKKNDKNERVSVLLQSKLVDWKALHAVVLMIGDGDGPSTTSSTTTTSSLSDSLLHMALYKACLDPAVCEQTIKLLVDKTDSALDVPARVKLTKQAVRCHNMTATRVLVQHHDGDALLQWRDIRSNTVLHLVCAECGWNAEIAFLLESLLQLQVPGTNTDSKNDGLFESNVKHQCPLWLSLEAGADLVVILDYLTHHHPLYVKKHLEHMTQIMAEYCNDMSGLEQLVEHDPSLLDGKSGMPLYCACYYQNIHMIRFLLQHYLRRGEKRRKLLKRMMTGPTKKDIHNEKIDMKAPLTCLILGVGKMDAGNSIACLQTCWEILGNFPILHYTIDKVLWVGGIAALDAKHVKQCLQTVTRMVDQLHIDLLSLDDKRRSLLSALIMQQPAIMHSKSFRGVFEYILSECPDLAFTRDRQQRLPLHLACEQGCFWNEEEPENETNLGILAQLVQAYPSALEVVDPKSKLYPCALAHDVNTIYNLLRYQPGVLCA